MKGLTYPFLLNICCSSVCFFLQSVSINEFLKPAEGERFYGGRGRGRGRGDRGGFRGGYGGGYRAPPAAPAIQDQSQFPSLGAK
jgi:plasminogen activator inhibitor 1 RNA-binding protein